MTSTTATQLTPSHSGFYDTFPVPPVDMVMPATEQNVLLVLHGTFFIIALLYAAKKAINGKDLLPIYFFLGGGLCSTIEALGFHLTQGWHPEIGQITAYTAYGRPIPLHTALIYFFFCGTLINWFVNRYEQGVTHTWLVGSYFVIAFLMWLFQLYPLHTGTHTFYGNQLFILGFTPWQGGCNAGLLILSSAIIYKVLPYLSGWRQVLLIPLMPIAVICAVVASIFPWSFLSSNTTNGIVVTSIGGVLSVLMTLLLIWLAGHIIRETPKTIVQ